MGGAVSPQTLVHGRGGTNLPAIPTQVYWVVLCFMLEIVKQEGGGGGEGWMPKHEQQLTKNGG